PINSPAGGWWVQTYITPDVALNHPTRWNITQPGTDPNNGTRLPIGPETSDVNCAALYPAFPDDPWTSEFHVMRGFFITVAEANAQASHHQAVPAGVKRLLQARVYNYSLAAMPEGTQVHVRFYCVPWHDVTPAGPSFLIGEATQGPIPPSIPIPPLPIG